MVVTVPVNLLPMIVSGTRCVARAEWVLSLKSGVAGEISQGSPPLSLSRKLQESLMPSFSQTQAPSLSLDVTGNPRANY